jgi:hypothetical protein
MARSGSECSALQFVGEKRLLRLDEHCLNLGLSTPTAALLTKWIGIRAQSLMGWAG